MAKTVKTEEAGGSKIRLFSTKKDAVVRELNEPINKFTGNDIHSGQAVVAKDERGEYVTSTYYVGFNLADPFKFNRITAPVAPIVIETIIVPDKAVEAIAAEATVQIL
jgi:hypothetical protein